MKKTALMPFANLGVITLANDSFENVTYYLHWAKSDGEIACTGEKGHDEEFDFLVHLYCFGEKYGDKAFKKSVIDAFFAKTGTLTKDNKCWVPPLKATTYLFEHTPADSPLRKLVKDIHRRGKPDQLKALASGNGVALCFLDVIGQLVEDAKKTPAALKRGDYHEK